jgi:poly-gamma-glutamate capsule biosynthesis protein CapA/YwtB (metallophosphatase superfamily)
VAGLTFAAAGDCIIARRVSQQTDPDFLELVQLVRGADAAFANLEIMTPKQPWIPFSEYGGMHLAAPPFVLDELRWFGFNLFGVANNHAVDYTFHGLLDTLAELKARGMVYAGGGTTLGEARSPGYLETRAGRVGLVACASTFMTSAQAAEARTDMGGRPGINPLRHERAYELPAELLAWLQRIDEALGTAAVTRRQRAFGVTPDPHPDAYRFLGAHFRAGETARVRTSCHPRDLEEIGRWIGDARRQVDLLVVSIHGHEGQDGDSNCPSIADFLVEAAHGFVDAGADVVVGHGPHRLRAIEIYRGKPIFYSLGNFMFMFESVAPYPAEMYERQHLGADAKPSDVHDAWAGREGAPNGFHKDPAFWEGVLPVCRFEDGVCREIALHPVELGLPRPRPERGCPRLAGEEHGRRILADLAELSAPLGTAIRVERHGTRSVGRVAL